MTKLTREQIREGLEQVPLEALLTGSIGAKEKRLNAKDTEFARQLALGESKAEAYRRSRKTNPKPQSASRRGQALAKDDAIQSQAEAFRVALEAERLRTPAALRALVINKLTEKVLDTNVKDAQHLKALELLGKVTEVAAFTERREVVKLSASLDIRAQLIASISEAMKAGGEDPDTIDADTLLKELAAPTTSETPAAEPHPEATPQATDNGGSVYAHTNPLIQSSPESCPDNNINSC
jgi:protoporphyrinogen oxidase